MSQWASAEAVAVAAGGSGGWLPKGSVGTLKGLSWWPGYSAALRWCPRQHLRSSHPASAAAGHHHQQQQGISSSRASAAAGHHWQRQGIIRSGRVSLAAAAIIGSHHQVSGRGRPTARGVGGCTSGEQFCQRQRRPLISNAVA